MRLYKVVKDSDELANMKDGASVMSFEDGYPGDDFIVKGMIYRKINYLWIREFSDGSLGDWEYLSEDIEASGITVTNLEDYIEIV